jgi:hypothetical protein
MPKPALLLLVLASLIAFGFGLVILLTRMLAELNQALST